MEGFIDIRKLNLQELAGVVNIYPWFSLARKELCERLCAMGDWGIAQYAEAAMYMSDRKVLARLLRKVEGEDYSDRSIGEILERCVSPGEERRQAQERPRVIVAGGDYFTQDEYERVRRPEDSIFPVRGAASGQGEERSGMSPEYEFCTETLAQIYAEQGYHEQARNIYSKLILAYPEKNAYFAALIEKLNSENQNL